MGCRVAVQQRIACRCHTGIKFDSYKKEKEGKRKKKEMTKNVDAEARAHVRLLAQGVVDTLKYSAHHNSTDVFAPINNKP